MPLGPLAQLLPFCVCASENLLNNNNIRIPFFPRRLCTESIPVIFYLCCIVISFFVDGQSGGRSSSRSRINTLLSSVCVCASSWPSPPPSKDNVHRVVDMKAGNMVIWPHPHPSNRMNDVFLFYTVWGHVSSPAAAISSSLTAMNNLSRGDTFCCVLRALIQPKTTQDRMRRHHQQQKQQ